MNQFDCKNYQTFPARIALTKNGELKMLDGSNLQEYLTKAFAAFMRGREAKDGEEVEINFIENFHFNRVQNLISEIDAAINKSARASREYAQK
jgi:hypothetical protein